jgi:exopolysaccharide production protein ExoZ
LDRNCGDGSARLGEAQFHVRTDLSRFIGSLLVLPTLSGTKLLPVVIQGWTLVFEMIFYALFTIALFFRQQYRIYLLAAALIGMASCHLLATEPHVAAITNPILLEFLAGVALGMVWQRVAIGAGIALALAFAGATGLALTECLKPDLHAVLKFGAPAAVLYKSSN